MPGFSAFDALATLHEGIIHAEGIETGHNASKIFQPTAL
jgi:hypothetical protein